MRWDVKALLAIAIAVVGCEPSGATTTPADGGGALERMEGRSTPDPTADGAAGPQAATDKKVVPKVRDRDPEEEKKKMALSRQRSAEARRMLASGRLAEALDHSRQALKIHEQNVDAMLVMAEAYYRQEKFELVQAVTSSALSVDAKIRSPQETSRAHNLKGFAYAAMGNDNLSTQSFRKAAEADDKNASAWNNLGTRYMQAGDVATAKQCFTYALELQPKLAKAHLNLGAALRAEGKWTDAEKSLQTALKLRPNWAEAFFNLGVLYLDADPYPGLETVARLNKSIQYLTKYRELAVADGPSGPAKDPTAGIARTGKHRKGPAPGPAAVSKDRAEDYIRVAKKGIEREERKAEREKARAKKPGEAAASDKPPSQTGAPTTPTKPDATAPTKPTAKPETPTAPTAKPPTTPAPAQKPSAPAAKPTTPPSSGTPTPSPKSPSAPTTPAPTAPQAPKTQSPQAPKTQAPTQTPKPPKSALREPPRRAGSRSARWAWNPRDAADTQRSGACDTMLVDDRDVAADSTVWISSSSSGCGPFMHGCDRGCASRRARVDHAHADATNEYALAIVVIASSSSEQPPRVHAQRVHPSSRRDRSS